MLAGCLSRRSRTRNPIEFSLFDGLIDVGQSQGKMNSMQIKPARRIEGRVRLPGDKSISHRAALVAAMATGKSQITNFSSSQDCVSTLSCLEQLGISITREKSKIQIESSGRFHAPSGPLDCGNSGSTMRMLAGILAGQNFNSILTGDNSLLSRPMKRIIAPLELMSARVFSENGRAPLRIEGHSPLKPIEYELPIASAQLKTCILFAGLQADGRTKVKEKLGLTRDHTERMLKWFGASVDIVPVSSSGASTMVLGPASFAGREVSISGDFSSATFLIAAAALLPDSELQIEGLGLNPTRTQFLETLRPVGARIEVIEQREDCNEPVGTIRIRSIEPGETNTEGVPLTISGQLTASLIDELPLLAVVGTQLPGGLVIRDAEELRFKETDRISAVVKNLRAMGAEVSESEDGLAVAGPVRLKSAQIDSCGDHRIAMAFSIAGLLAEGESEISNSECVAVSFPEFFECLETIVER
jgi:3-phosphoshikimate 1-carboxyvinyltransferase